MDLQAAKMIGAGLATIAMLGVGLGLGQLFSSLLNSTARNPEEGKNLFKLGMIGAALTESVALLAFIVAMIILLV